MNALKTLFDMSVDLLCVAGADGHFRLVNPAFERVLGYSEDEIKQAPFIDFVHPDDRDSTLAEVAKLARGLKTLRFENRYRCKDGSYRWLAWTSVPDAEAGLLYAVARDITESKRSLDHLMNDLPGVVYRCRNDRDWSMEFVSNGCRELTGYAPEQLLAGETTFSDLIHPEDRERVSREVQQAIGSKREFELEYRITTADGKEKFVWERGRAIGGTGGEVEALQGFVTDITERRKLRADLTQMQKMESIGQLTGGIAHDFNNLLAVVLGNLELLEASVERDEEASELLRDAMEAAWRGAELSQRLLAFSRRQMLEPEVVSVASLIEGMESLLRRTLGGAIEIEIAVPNSLPRVLVDPSQLENAILNLAINARDAMPEGGQLRIGAAPFKADDEYAAARPDAAPGCYVMIEVSDTGTGMSPEVQQRAFEPFFTTKDVSKGTGLGLSMVYGFLQQSGGHARIYSELGHGTSVKLYLPQAQHAEETKTGQTLTLLNDSQGRSESILVVEDDAKVRRMVVATLRDLGYETLEAECGAAGLEVLRSDGASIDLLFTDVVMPGMSGLELARKAREDMPDLRVLLTSGFSEQQAAGGSGFPLLTKPYRKVQLAQALRRALG
ncbi:MAG TPA: PAS domain-containing protein [Gammaproteobacteria bacterium]|nr:PAS domain-containing protein [Gammaproteobacteria bacterium]